MSNKKIRTPMPIAQRAKQFAPFAAVGGLDVALRRKEEEHRREVEAEVEGVLNPEINVVEYNVDGN